MKRILLADGLATMIHGLILVLGPGHESRRTPRWRQSPPVTVSINSPSWRPDLPEKGSATGVRSPALPVKKHIKVARQQPVAKLVAKKKKAVEQLPKSRGRLPPKGIEPPPKTIVPPVPRIGKAVTEKRANRLPPRPKRPVRRKCRQPRPGRLCPSRPAPQVSN